MKHHVPTDLQQRTRLRNWAIRMLLCQAYMLRYLLNNSNKLGLQAQHKTWLRIHIEDMKVMRAHIKQVQRDDSSLNRKQKPTKRK